MCLVRLLTFFNILLSPNPAYAHVSEQGFVLLLPTEIYSWAGVAVVVATVGAVLFLPHRFVHRLFAVQKLSPIDWSRAQEMSSVLSLGFLMFLVFLGVTGPRDPLSNLMPLVFWTGGWICLVSLSGIFGNLWLWLNPWTGLYALLGSPAPLKQLPNRLDLWPVLALLIGFSGFLLADPAPDDPTRLAYFVAGYWVFTMTGLLVFGPPWMRHCELGHAVFYAISHLSVLRLNTPAGVGGPGWQMVRPPQMRLLGVFALVFLAVGSFDGLNETFWWLAQIDVNPLEFPGRSAVMGATWMGLIGAIGAMLALFASVVWVGVRLSGVCVSFTYAFGALGLTVLPIAFAYHVSHYLTSFMVSSQYLMAALSDPFATGADLLGIQPFRVTTGFFNNLETVKMIWLTQASLVVVGHVWSVLAAHCVALDVFGSNRRAFLATLPLSMFMIGYTFLGLWLLAAPKGA